MRRCSALLTAVLSAAFAVGAVGVGFAQQQHGNIAQSLPATNLSSVRQADPDVPPPAPGFANARVADNPLAPDAKPVGERMCVSCHQLEADHFTHTLHSLGLHVANKSDPNIPVCEACHGPGSAHAEKPHIKGLIIGYDKAGGSPIEVQTKTCLTCHSGGPRDHWLGSVHQRNGLSCSDCHNPMARFSVEGAMAKMSINDTCAQCHKDVRLQFNRRSHMPVPEGQMSCDDCHNPHGSVSNASVSLQNFPLSKTNTVNETCYQCHAEKRGPFLFEHPPVRESCLNCHTPHGSNQSTLLVTPVPFLCEQCHGGGHYAQVFTPGGLATNNLSGIPPGSNTNERLIGRGCLNCHTQVHGSNAAAGSRFHE